MGEVIYRGEEPELDPTPEDMAAYDYARATFQLSASDPGDWDKLGRIEKMWRVREARERLAAEKEASKVVPLRPLTTL